ncbi:hypothetical protein OSB04_009898 [Centaurea solstitialis]|uniref:Kinesin motor domain-containing protein n=1 Tax=Centaurea solstitialis TaxID=347529 RepID=A0AA38T6H5_9ASTR|nr:hypothetical protein OSB04_009898 [Centaurea solstitialis]
MNLHTGGFGSANGQSDGSSNVNGGGIKYTENNVGVTEVGDRAAAKVPEMTNLSNLENASSQSLFNIVHKILDDSIENRKDDVPDRVASLLKKLIQMIEQRISKQAEDFKKQNHLYKTREERYQMRVRVLETLANGAAEENKIIMNQLQHIKAEKSNIEEKKRAEDVELVRLRKEKNDANLEISELKQELDVTRDTYEKRCLQLETDAMEIKSELEKKMMDLENLLTDSRKKVKELEKFTESKFQRWKKKERVYKNFMDFQYGSLQGLRMGSESIKQEILKTQEIYSQEINQFGTKIQGLVDAAQNYHTVLTENRKLYNEVQDLKGNIRVYCRIRPFLKGQSQKQTAIEYIGENGELVVTNPSKQIKESHRLFKFNKVFSPAATQEEVFLDTQPLIRSVLDGYNVCIFAYGQTGSGKTYTMTGPNISSPEDWGVNYRALNDLFHLSQARRSSFEYEIGVQMVEIYNEQMHTLTFHTLGIWNSTQPNGLAVPDASMHPVTSTADVLELMHVGLMNRAVGATALNERSSRSHSVLTVHVRGTDLETNGVLRGNLHLVDLAGSERVDRSEATGERLREAQHINKSLSALGDVIFALAQKSQHVPYRNSKLTQVLQSSLGGQAKTLMFVQLNPDVESFSETISTLKFAERGLGVELGAARSNKEGRGVRELMEQEVFLDTQPLIRSVLDGYNVCIFAYGQTGSGKTYTMMHTLTFHTLGIWNSTQPNGLAVPDASMHPVTSTADVLELMHVGLMNRAVGATALNERSSRSHSVLTVHVRGTDLETNGVLRGNLHLVDLAGSERVDRSEATGERLREAQHINKSLSALGDVIFALAQKSQHVPYRNSKLTQVLQSSLGGQAKTLMFVQLNPDVESFSETISTLKFAERVSGVELGAARSNKEGRGVRELMEQVTCLKDALTKKDEEIAQLRLRKTNSSGSSSPRRLSIGGLQPNGTPPCDKSLGFRSKAASGIDNCSEFSDKQSESSSSRSTDELRHHKEVADNGLGLSEDGESRFGAVNAVQDLNDDIELVGLGDGDSDERLSDISDGVLSMGTETDGSLSSIVELSFFPETAKAPVDHHEKPNVRAKLPRPPQKAGSSARKTGLTAPSSQRLGLSAPSRPSLTKGVSSSFPLTLPQGYIRQSSTENREF